MGWVYFAQMFGAADKWAARVTRFVHSQLRSPDCKSCSEPSLTRCAHSVRLPWLVRGRPVAALWTDLPFDHRRRFEEPDKNTIKPVVVLVDLGGGCNSTGASKP